MNESFKTTKLVKKIVTYIAIFLITLGIGTGIGKILWGQDQKIIDPSGRPIPPTPTPTPKTKYGFLLLGGGGAGHQGGELTDTMIVAEVDMEQKKILLVNIPRDLWVPIINKETQVIEYKKINFAYSLGGPNEVKKWANTISGVPIDYYAWIDFGGFVKLIDTLGGLEVSVPMAFVDELYPIAGKEVDPCGKSPEEIKQLTATLSGTLVDKELLCRYERLEFLQGKTQMDGATVLKFVRSRHAVNGGGDFSRSMRQQAVIEAVRNKMIKPGTWSTVPTLINQAKSYVVTDLKFDEVWKEVIKISDLNSFTINRVTISTDNVLKEGYSFDRQYILTPSNGDEDWTSIQKFIEAQK